MKLQTIVAGLVGMLVVALAGAQDAASVHSMPQGDVGDKSMSGEAMAHMPGHMYMTKLRPMRPGDQQKADAVVAKVRAAIEPYKDYHKALADGYKIFLEGVHQRQYHFTNYGNAREARGSFDPSKPTSLLYKNAPGGGYQLVGVMYTDGLNAPESELDNRIPLSIAQWHQHINFCQAPTRDRAAYMGPNAKFGLQGSIITQKDCEAAGGTFRPHLFGWMVHLYPFESDPKRIWSTNNDEDGHDNMDHSTMPGMKMD